MITAEVNAWQLVDLYHKRAGAEYVFDELKNQWGFHGFCSRRHSVIEMAIRQLLLVYPGISSCASCPRIVTSRPPGEDDGSLTSPHALYHFHD
ncbi:MAG: hypothetical protein RLZZ408_705 [Verrucomicrobiota bacterium]|jgi:hypothetical protein